MQTITDLLPYVLGGYEVVTRAIPTKKNISLIHGILKVLLFVSDLLNKGKQSANEKA